MLDIFIQVLVKQVFMVNICVSQLASLGENYMYSDVIAF